MNLFKSKMGTAAEPQPDLMTDQELEKALVNFRESVHGWSDAEFNRPRTVHGAAYSNWRPMLAWTLGLVVVAGGVSGGIYDHHRIVVERQQTAARIAHERQLAEQQKAREDESLLANVDTDVSRSVPAAMEPLAQLMEDDGTN
jgi:hypothetical protein